MDTWDWQTHTHHLNNIRSYTALHRTMLLTVCSTVLEKLTGSRLVKKFPTFYGTRRFITAFTSARRLSLSWARPFQSMPPPPSDPTSSITILILSSHPHLGLPSGLHSDLLTEILYEPPFSPHTCYMLRPSRSSLSDQPNNIFWAVQIIKLLVM